MSGLMSSRRLGWWALSAVLCALWTAAFAVEDAAARPVRFGPATLLGDRSDRTGAQIQAVAINSRGEAVAVWTRRQLVRVATRTAAGRWEPPVTLSRPRRCIKQSLYDVAMNARGDAVVAWDLGCDGDGLAFAFAVVTRAAHRGWSAPRIFERASSPQVGMTARGVAVLTWRRRGVWVATGRGSRWSPPMKLRTSSDVQNLALDVHANGRAAAIWCTPSAVMVSRRSRGGAWMPPEKVWTPAEGLPGASLPLTNEQPIEVAIAGDGQVIGAWSSIQIVEYRPSQGWSARTLITPDEGWGQNSLDINDRGEAIIGWAAWKRTPEAQSDHGTVWGYNEVFAATRSATGTWSTPQQISSVRLSAFGPVVAVTGESSIFATWTISEPGERGRDAGVQAANGSVVSGWSAPVTLARNSNGGAGFVQLAAADGPHAIIGWNQGATRKALPTAWVSVTR